MTFGRCTDLDLIVSFKVNGRLFNNKTGTVTTLPGEWIMPTTHRIHLTLPLYLALWLVITALSVYAAVNLPADLRLPIHWNLHFEPDRYANKWLALMMLPMVSLLLTALLKLLPMLERRKANLRASSRAYQSIFWASQVFISLLQLFMILTAWQWPVAMGSFIQTALSVLLIALGLGLPHTRSNYLMGIRTPWTLSADEVWLQTHKVAGQLLTLLGGVALLTAPWANTWTLASVVTGLFMILVGSTLYSYVKYQQHQHARARRP